LNRRLLLPEEDDVTRQARLLLRDAGVGERLPTPVDDLVECAGLAVSAEAALDEDYIEYFGVREEYQKALGASSYAALKAALRKTWGFIDLIDNIIYLDRSVSSQKQGFLKLHEVGHKMLPWQRATFLLPDDKATLAPDIKALFEREANRFAAEALFQGDRFTRQSRDLPLNLETPLSLARWYGTSAHAAIRRFVEVSHRCCAVLILKPPRSGTGGEPSFVVAYEVRSFAFTAQFEGARFPRRLGPECALGAALRTGRRYVSGDGLLLPNRDGRRTECGFQTFRNSRSAFALVFPLSETMRRSRKKIKKKVVRM
jgi:hypothetical protein